MGHLFSKIKVNIDPILKIILELEFLYYQKMYKMLK